MIQPISLNDFVCENYKSRTQSFTKKPNVKIDVSAIEKKAVLPKQASSVKLTILWAISELVGYYSSGKKRLYFTPTTGKLKNITTYEKVNDGLQIKEKKHYYPNRKLSELDEYKNGKLVKLTSYQNDGKTPKWITEYGEKEDLTKEFYADGKSLKAFTVDNGPKSYITRYDNQGRRTSEEFLVDDTMQTENIYDIAKKTVTKNQYKDGKLVYSRELHKEGSVDFREIYYDEAENIKNIKIFYRDKKQHAEATYEGDIRTVKKYVNNELKLTEITNRRTKEVKRIYPSKKSSNVKNS